MIETVKKAFTVTCFVLCFVILYWFFFVNDYNSFGASNTDVTPRVGLELMHFNEGQPHLTFNDLAYFIDALTFPTLKTYPTAAAPPESPAEGDMYIVPSGATGDWSGYDNYLTMYRNTSWALIAPSTGWIVNKPDFSTLRYDGSAWTAYTGSVSSNDITVQSSGVPGINLQSDYITAMIGITTGLANAEIIKVTEESTNTPMFLLGKYGVGGAYIHMGSQATSLYDGSDTLLLHPRDPSFLYGNLYLGGGSTGYAETPLVIAGAVTLSVTDTPADPAAGNAVIWLGATGSLFIKSNIGATVRTGTLFEYVP